MIERILLLAVSKPCSNFLCIMAMLLLQKQNVLRTIIVFQTDGLFDLDLLKLDF